MTAASPTPPAPTTSSGRPEARSTALSTAPTPVITAQAEIAAISVGTSSGTGSTLVSDTTTCSAKQETPIRWCSVSPPACSRLVPSIRPFVLARTRPKRQSTGLPETHAGHSPQRGRHCRATRSPTATRPAVRGPSASTTPAPS